jgi:thiosulfate/3-mercaptopyruvate sulfurtransferase
MRIRLLAFLGFIVALLLLISLAGGICTVGGCGGGDDAWAASAQSFISSDAPIVGSSQNQNTPSSSFKVGVPESGRVNTTLNQTIPNIGGEYVQPDSRTEPFLAPQLIEPMNSISGKDVVLDVSNQRSPGEAHIAGAVRIPSKSFLSDNGTLRPVSELVAQLGKAGISDKDAVVVYSDTFGSGEAAFVLWMLRYLGQENVQALDGGLQDWIAASLPLETKENVRPQSKYVPHLRPELLFDYDFIKSGKAQLVDARTFQDYGKSRIPNAIFIDPESLLEGGRIKAASNLNDTFARLSRSQTVAVYSNDLLNASLVWYALQLMGFDSGTYTWQDWQAHEGAVVT